MAIEITNTNKNPLLGREELTGKLTFEAATPKKEDVAKAVADATKSTVEKIVVKKNVLSYRSFRWDGTFLRIIIIFDLFS